MTHSCIKCKEQYDSADDDAYYCSSCLAEKNALAKEIDARMAMRDKSERHMSGMEAYESAPKGPGGFMIVRL